MVSRPKLRLFRYSVPVITVLAFIFSFRQCGKQERPTGYPHDYAAIVKEGITHAVTEYNSISFYVDSDTISGPYYELIQASVWGKGLKTEITPIMGFEEWLEGLSKGRYDVIAHGILVTSRLKDFLPLTSLIFLNKQVLVQHKGTGENDSLYIRTQLDLVRRTLHVAKGSPSVLRIQDLGNEIGDTIYIKEIDKYGFEQLISMVAHGDINYAVCDEGIALAAADSLLQTDINTAAGFTQFYSRAVSEQSSVLLDSLSTWLGKFQKEKEYQKIYKKYYDKE